MHEAANRSAVRSIQRLKPNRRFHSKRVGVQHSSKHFTPNRIGLVGTLVSCRAFADRARGWSASFVDPKLGLIRKDGRSLPLANGRAPTRVQPSGGRSATATPSRRFGVVRRLLADRYSGSVSLRSATCLRRKGGADPTGRKGPGWPAIPAGAEGYLVTNRRLCGRRPRCCCRRDRGYTRRSSWGGRSFALQARRGRSRLPPERRRGTRQRPRGCRR